ncbi:hypothetical protein Y032_0006g2922 [Ancylostoma ceylanicum]|nr:hypothetical protein Y032_0006g2922 [Ancylostoma ceylanicum]
MSLLVSVYICIPKNISNRPAKNSKLTPTSKTPAAAGRVDAAKEKGNVGKTTGRVTDAQLAKTQECDALPEPANVKAPKKAGTEAATKDTFEFQKKAVDDGIVLHPSCVKHMGNIDELALERRAQLEKDVEALKSDRDKSIDRDRKPDPKLKVRINEKNCVLYETNDAPTLDEQDENEENMIGDLY